jgi:flagellar hook-associated protein FlgK
MSEDSIEDVIQRINESDNQAEAYLSAENRLVIKGSQENNYELSQLEDDGLLLDKANVLSVGGSNRTAGEGLNSTSINLTAPGGDFAGDARLDAIAENADSGRPQPNGIDLAEGTLDFDSSISDNFQINYDAREDSLEDIVNRINDRATAAGSNVRAGIGSNNRLQIFSFENTQDVTAPAPPITGTQTLSVSDAGEFTEGQEIGVFEDTAVGGNQTDAEVTRVEDVNESANTITVDLNNNYDQNIRVTEDFDSSFRVNDEASQQIRSLPTTLPSGEEQIEVKDSSVFELGQTIRIATNDGSAIEEATVTAINTNNDTVTVDNLTAPGSFTAGAGDAGSAIQVNDNTNRNRQLLSALGMERKLTSQEPATEFAIEGQDRRPPVAAQATSLRVREEVIDNPDLVAAAKGDDVDLDGIAESTRGPGDGANAQDLSNLKREQILKGASQTPDEQVNKLITDIGGEKALADREKSASDKLVNDLKNQRQQISGVNIDEELTKMLQRQQVFQASTRIIQTVQQLNQSVLQIV